MAVVLIADDETDVRQLQIDYLQHVGFQIIEASNGELAWQLYKKHSPDIVVTDVRMPIMNGIQLLKAIREENKDFPVIVITGYAVEEAIEVERLGASKIIVKPFKLTDLLDAVNEALNK